VKRILVSLSSFVLVCSACFAQTVCFNEVDTNTGNPNKAVVIDSNHDGKLDLAMIGSASQGFAFNINSLLGNGSGGFSKVKAYHGPPTPEALAAGDFNGDGNVDLAVAFNTSNTSGVVAILLGNGDGTFGNVHQIHTAEPSVAIVAGDFNGDGKLDVAVTTGPYASTPADIELLLGNGDGTLQAPTVVTSLPWYTTALSVADLNGDGKLDLVSDGGNTNNNSQIVTVLLGNGNGTFQSPATYTAASLTVAQTMAIADLNGDGKLDVAVPGGAGIDIFFGTGTGTLTGPTSVTTATSPLSIAAVDLFGNGSQDLVTSDGSGAPRIDISINNGTGTFTSQTYNVLSTNYYVYAADFNNDGKPDLLVLYIDHSGIGVLLNCS
jgi:uncharacterized protein (DUF2141 family)